MSTDSQVPQSVASPQVDSAGGFDEVMDYDPTQDNKPIPQPGDRLPQDAPASSPAAQPGAAPQSPRIPEEMLIAAEALGFDRSAAMSFQTPEALGQALRTVASMMMRRQTAPPPEQLEPDTQPPAVVPAQPAKPAGEAVAASQAALEKLKLEVEDDEFDERALQLLNKLNDHYHAIAERQQAEIQRAAQAAREMLQYRQMLEQERLEMEADRFFDRLGDGFVETFGQGPAAELPPNSEQMKNRSEVYGQAMTIAEGLLAQGKPIPPMAELLKMAVGLSHFDKAQQIAAQKITKQVNQRRSQAIARPSSRPTTSAASGEERAAEFASRWFTERGIPVPSASGYLDELAE